MQCDVKSDFTTDPADDAKKIVIWQDDLKSTEMIQVQNIRQELLNFHLDSRAT